MISTLYVAIREDHHLVQTAKGKNIGVEVLGYTDDMNDGMKFIETVAAKDVYGRDWTFNASEDPFYDPQNEDNLPPSDGKFVVWDEDIVGDDPVLDRPTTVLGSASVYSEKPDRYLLRSYKLCRANPMVADFVRATSEGDRMMERQIACGM